MALMSGAIFAQALTILFAPLLTRLYTPLHFGSFAMYASVASLFSVFATARYDSAVMLPDNDDDAANIAAVSICATLLVALTALLLVLSFKTEFASLLEATSTNAWFILVPLSVLLSGVSSVLYNWVGRGRDFKALSLSKVTGSTSGLLTNLGFGLTYPSLYGLILGGIANQFCGAWTLGRAARKDPRWSAVTVSTRKMKQLARRYIRFPIYSLPSDAINSIAQQLPIIMFGTYFNSAVVGYYALTQRILSTPISLVSSAITDVFRQRASADYARTGNCTQIFKKTLLTLTVLGILPTVLFAISAPWLFRTVFGANWAPTGEYAQLMAPLFFLRFVVSPLTYVLYIGERQDWDLWGQSALLVVTAASIWVGASIGGARMAIALYVLSYSIVYLVYLYLAQKCARGKSEPL